MTLLFLVPLRRLGLPFDLLEKAQGGSSQAGFSRGPKTGHKYIRREFLGYVNGKARWRYWYRDDKQRELARAGNGTAEEAHKESEHALIGDLKKVFQNLADKMIAPSTCNEGTLKEQPAFGGRDVKFKIHPKFYERHHAPFVDNEKKGDDLERTPLTRVMRALQLVPPEMAAWLGQSKMKELEITTYDDGKNEKKLSKGVSAYAQRNGKLVLLANAGDIHGTWPGTFGAPHGAARYGSKLTWTESVVWHEMGHHVHYALEDHAPKVWAEWKQLSAMYSKDRISDYAHTNEKEDFAESIACMIAHPKQMAIQCPHRYDFFRKHGIVNGPSREDMITKVGDEELEWWRGKQISPAGKLAAEMKLRMPTTYVDAFQSPKDQFYSVMYKGRQIFFRVGPRDAHEEDGWEKIAPTVDPETGLPVFDQLIAQRFRARENFKEIYDENGNAITQEQALLWLRQDDEDFAEKFKDISSLDTYSALGASEKATHALAFQLFLTLGENRGEQAAERARVAKLRAAGKDATLDRHAFAPHEMSPREFINATPTFKFNGLREAAEQPWLKLEVDRTKKPPRSHPVKVRNPVTGKDEFVRSATVYEMENPDGTKTKIMVNESDAFSIGQKILVPRVKTKTRPDGTTTKTTVWEPYTIPVAMDPDPSKLAREFNTTVEQLLRQNGRYAKGQITDELLAGLLNPAGQPIRSAGDLIGLMRDAAKRGASSWCTFASGNADNPSNAHFKVRFDGGGNPIVEGEYWARRYGLPQGARLDQILTKRNEVKVDRIIEVKAEKIPVAEGVTVSYRDPKSGRQVLGTVTKMTKTEHGTEYGIKPVKGQGTGLMKRAVVTEVKEITTDIVPAQPNTRRRRVKPLKNDMLLYLDNLKYEHINEKGQPEGAISSGMIKILAPLDGSITTEEIARLPGVRTVKTSDPKSGAEVEELTIDRRDISVLREAFGGFVMDQHVTSILEDLASSEKKRALSAAKREVVAPSQLVNADGQVNTDGLLKGLRSVTGDGKPFKLGSHQVDFLQACARAEGRIMGAHFMGTGKTVSALAAIQMMKNAKDPNDTSKPVPGSPRKRVCIVVPLNTINQWESATSFFTQGAATVVGADSLSNAVQAFKWPERKSSESEETYMARVRAARAEACAKDPQKWNPDKERNDIVVVPFEYFRDNEHDLRAFGGFDGLVVDEAHAIAKENELSRAVERWNPSMEMLMLLTGTPVTNKIDTVPRIVDLLSKGRSPLGSAADFKDRYLVESQVMVAHGAKRPAKTDINPQLAGELGSILQQYMHVATTEDVKGKTMPAVLLDENQPAHMIGIQEQMYRAAMASLTDEDREKLEQSSALGLDEQQMLSPKARRKVQVARNFANSPGYKAPNAQPFLTYLHKEAKKDKKGVVETVETPTTFTLPDHATLLRAKPEGWGGSWPSMADVSKGRIQDGYYAILVQIATQMTKQDYESALAGKKISKEHLAAIKDGALGGIPWGKVPNPEYGPEGAICRGVLEEGELSPIVVEHEGKFIEVPAGLRFMRLQKPKASGLYYHEDDWDFTGAVSEGVEGEGGEGGEEGGEEEEGGSTRGEQKPKAGRERHSVQRSPERRRERAMFDGVMTHGNAKCDELERYIMEKTNTAMGGNPDAQFILFGNRVGSSCRTMESKMRSMGYMDVNEALGAESTGYSSDSDRARRPKTGRYFVTYFGKGASLGERDINSEIFRKVKDPLGRDTDVSMFVHRTNTGSIGTPPKVGEFKEGWSRAERADISKLFAGPNGEDRVEIPMRVTRMEDGSLGYVYESDIRATKGGAKVIAELRDLERERNGAAFEDKGGWDAKMNAIFAKHVSTRKPLSTHQMDVFNNCQVMVASDAAQVGLNWGNASELVMYDSLHSPMLEWQRITRAARMLDAIIPDKAQPLFDKLDEHIKAHEEKTGFKEYGDLDSALSIVREAFESLPTAVQNDAMQMGFDPQVAAEAYFAKRAFDKIATLRQPTRDRLRAVGRKLEPVERTNATTGEIEVHQRYLRPQEITSSDVINEIVEEHLTPFERQILKSRKYLVNVKRLTTSVNMPEFETVKDPESGKKVTRATGNFYTEVPSRAEQAQLTSGRSKQVPYEAFLKTVQDAHEVKTDYDFIPVNPSSLGRFSVLPKGGEAQETPEALSEPITKSLPRFYVTR